MSERNLHTCLEKVLCYSWHKPWPLCVQTVKKTPKKSFQTCRIAHAASPHSRTKGH